MFSFAGFEFLFAISHRLKRREQGPYVVLYAFAIVVALYVLYQTSVVFLGTGFLKDLTTFDIFFNHIFRNIFDAPGLYRLLMGSVAVAALGSAYAILAGNGSNLYVLAKKRLLRGSTFLLATTQSEALQRAMICLNMLALIYIFSIAHSTILVQVSACGTFFTYLSFTCAYIRSAHGFFQKVLAIGGVLSCLGCAWGLVINACIYGYKAYALYGLLLLVGFCIRRKREWHSRMKAV